MSRLILRVGGLVGLSGRRACAGVFRAAVLSGLAAVLVLGAAAGAAGQPQHWADPNNFRSSGPLFWLPEAHANWPRLSSMWLPVDACSGDPYAPSGGDVHNQSCPWSYRVWAHRVDRAGAELEFGRGSSFDHDDLNTSLGTNSEMNPWHWRLSGMPESQRCMPADRDTTTHKFSGGWGGLQVTQHIGEWYQGSRYLPDMSGDPAGVVLYGYFDFDVYSRPADMTQWQEGECAAHAVYDQYHTGAGGRAAGDARQCAANSVPLIMRGNSELRCEPDLELWETHVYAEDFKEILDRYLHPMEWPTQADGWWPRPGETFTHDGVVRDIRAFLRSVGMSPPVSPEFPHTWREECQNDGLFGCGPGDTERDRLNDPVRQEEYGSRPLARRFEVMIGMPGESEDDSSARAIPDEWVAAFDGYASEPLGDTPGEARENRTASFSAGGEPDFGSREWLQDFLTDDGGELRFVGTRLADVLDDALAWSGDTEVNPSDCLRLLPSDAPVADREAPVVADEFWNSPEWRECAGQAFSAGGTGRLSAGITGLNTWLRHQGGDVDRERNLEVAGTNLDVDGWAVGSPEVERDFQLGMPEVPAANQAILNGLLGLDAADVAWYRTGGVEISCLWGGFYQTDLVASAQAMEDSAREELEKRVGELADVQEALQGELGETRRPDIRTWDGGRTPVRTTSLGCATDGVSDFLDEWEQQRFRETCLCNTTILGQVNVVDCPTSRVPDQSGQSMNSRMCSTVEWWEPRSLLYSVADPTCRCGGTSVVTTCNGDGTSTTFTTVGYWDGAACQTSDSSRNNGADPTCTTTPWCTPSWSVACDQLNGANTGTWTWTDANNCPGAAAPTGRDPFCPTTDPPVICECWDCEQVQNEDFRWVWVHKLNAPKDTCPTDAEICPGESGFPANFLCSRGQSDFAPSGADPSIIGRSPQIGGAGARPADHGRSSWSSVSPSAAPGRLSVQDSVSGASSAFMNDASRGAPRASASSAGASAGSLSAEPPLPGGVSDWVRSRADRARQQARRYAAEPADRRSFQSGARAMRDGVALAEVIAANRLEASLGAAAGGPPSSPPVGAGGFASGAFAPLSRSTERASVRSVASAADVPLAAAAPPVSGGVWAAADRGTDVAAGGWYGWNVDGTPCASGTACADAMTRAFTTQSSWTIPSLFNCASNVGFVGPFCLFQLFVKRQQLINEIILWSGTMQGWIAIKEYRQEVHDQIASSYSPYVDWSNFGGSMPDVGASSYVTAATGLSVSNPMCVLPPATNPVPLHSMGEQDTVAYRNANDTNSPAIWDDTGTRRLQGGGLGQGVWPPTDALQDVVLRDGSTRTMAPGRYEAGETLLELRGMFYGDQWPAVDPPYDPEAFDRFGAPSVQNFDPADYPNMPRTLTAADHLSSPSFLETPVIFRDLACPAVDEAGSFGTIRPVVCQDGTVRSAPLLLDHQTPCASGSEGCEIRVFSEPVLATGGAGYDAGRVSGGSASDDAYSDLFGPHYRHVCQFDSFGMITDVLDGRVAADEAVTVGSYDPYVYHWRAGAPGNSGEWVLGAGVGDGLEHGHNPDEGYYPRAGWYTDQNGEEVWFEPFSSYDNYGDVQTAGDFSDGEQELIMRGDAANPGELFVQHVDESRVLYDEFIATPYEVQARNADFQLWDEVRSGDVNTDDAHLIWGWPTLDLQDDQTDAVTRAQVMRVRRLTTQQKLFGVPPGSDQAEQVWVRNDGPMSFFGATRVGNGAGGSEKGGCLLEVNPSEPRVVPQGEAVPFRQVLDPTLQAWCVMSRDVGPEDSCISMPNAPLPALRRRQ